MRGSRRCNLKAATKGETMYIGGGLLALILIIIILILLF
jgi:hypothetical protein